jgi:hypothetical protein
MWIVVQVGIELDQKHLFSLEYATSSQRHENCFKYPIEKSGDARITDSALFKKLLKHNFQKTSYKNISTSTLKNFKKIPWKK